MRIRPATAMRVRPLTVIAAASALLSACAASGGSAGICEAAGGTYVDGTCTRSSPSLDAARRACGQDTCAFGMGGP
jgi:hypothetical protein